MDCELALQLVSFQIDGMISEEDQLLLDEHLRECPVCERVLADLRIQDRQLRHALMPPREVAVSFVRQLKKRLLSAEQPVWPRPSVLVVDDEPYLLPVLAGILGDEFEVLTADSANDAQQKFESRSIDIILTDQKMPHRTGVQLLEWVRQQSPQTVRLLMTGYLDLKFAVDAINRGHVYHYLLKPWEADDLRQTLRNATEKFRLERSQEQLLAEMSRLNQELEVRVSERTRKLEEANRLLQQRNHEMERLALTDPLTGLNNRRAMERLARVEIKRHSRHSSPLAIGMIDIDYFKRVNTDYKQTGGDEVLKELARLLSASLREIDSVGRIGGEEFLLVAPETDEQGARRLAERIRTRVASTPIHLDQHSINLTISLGFAVADGGAATDYQKMSVLAASALQDAKQNGRNRSEIRCLPA